MSEPWKTIGDLLLVIIGVEAVAVLNCILIALMSRWKWEYDEQRKNHEIRMHNLESIDEFYRNEEVDG